MNHIEQDWHAFKATLPLSRHMNWDDAITQHAEREYQQVRERNREESRARNGGRHNGTKRRTR